MTPTIQNMEKNVDIILLPTISKKKSAFSYQNATECLISILMDLNYKEVFDEHSA